MNKRYDCLCSGCIGVLKDVSNDTEEWMECEECGQYHTISHTGQLVMLCECGTGLEDDEIQNGRCHDCIHKEKNFGDYYEWDD